MTRAPARTKGPGIRRESTRPWNWGQRRNQMKTIVVVESAFGNTRSVADAIAEGAGEATVLDVREAGAVPRCDLLGVGGPTHAFGMSRPSTRDEATKQGGHGGGADAVGLREWLDGLAV